MLTRDPMTRFSPSGAEPRLGNGFATRANPHSAVGETRGPYWGPRYSVHINSNVVVYITIFTSNCGLPVTSLMIFPTYAQLMKLTLRRTNH